MREAGQRGARQFYSRDLFKRFIHHFSQEIYPPLLSTRFIHQVLPPVLPKKYDRQVGPARDAAHKHLHDNGVDCLRVGLLAFTYQKAFFLRAGAGAGAGRRGKVKAVRRRRPRGFPAASVGPALAVRKTKPTR